MTANADILVSCSNGACSLRTRTPLLDLETFILIHTDESIPGFDAMMAGKLEVSCPNCNRAGRKGTLLYTPDHLRKAAPDQATSVPAAYDPMTSVWKYAKVLYTAVRTDDPARPNTLTVPTGYRQEIRPYGGYVLQYGNNDKDSQYGEPNGQQDAPAKKGKYIRELKHDLLYLAYYGNRERSFDGDLGGVGAFTTMTVGAILALKFDLSLFYGVPVTTDIRQSAVSDDELRTLQLDTFSKPIFFDRKLPENPLKPIVKGLVYPLARAMLSLSTAHAMVGAALEQYELATAPGVKPRTAKKLRAKVAKALKAAANRLQPTPPGLDSKSLKAVSGVRKDRSLTDLLDHKSFAASKRKSWTYFETCVRRCFTLAEMKVESHAEALSKLADDADEDLTAAAASVLERFKVFETAFAAPDVVQVKQILGGLPETFEPYRVEMHKYAVVDHATAFYIKSILSGIKVGSGSGKVVAQPGRKLVFRMPEGGLKSEPASRKLYAEMVVTACKDAAGFYLPPMIMLERQKNESGFRASERVGDLAMAKEESEVVLPIVGIDWRNWGYLDEKEKPSNFAFSELFTNSVGEKQEHPGYKGPIVLSRGVGGGQVTLGTRLAGVSPKGLDDEGYGYQWVCGIPVPEKGKMPTPGNWTGAKGSIDMARDLLVKKFMESGAMPRDCTYEKVGGKKYDCASCLKRFQLNKNPDLRLCTKGKSPSYYCSLDASKWKELFGEDLTADSQAARTEYPCSWLRAVQKYAGASARGYERILKSSREIVAVGAAIDADAAIDDDDDELEETGAEDDDEGGGAPQSDADDDDDDADEPPKEPSKKPSKKPTPKQKDPKKKKDPDSAKAALRAAFEKVRKEL